MILGQGLVELVVYTNLCIKSNWFYWYNDTPAICSAGRIGVTGRGNSAVVAALLVTNPIRIPCNRFSERASNESMPKRSDTFKSTFSHFSALTGSVGGCGGCVSIAVLFAFFNQHDGDSIADRIFVTIAWIEQKFSTID